MKHSPSGFGCEPVAETEMCMDECPSGKRSLQLDAQLVDVHVNRAFTRPELSTPNNGEELLAGNDTVGSAGKLGEHPELDDREAESGAVHSSEVLRRGDLERSNRQDLLLL